MKHYELLLVLPGTFAEDEVTPQLKKVEQILTDCGASEVTHEDMGKTRLTYPMKHIRYGYYHLYQFAAEPAAVPEMQAKLRLLPEFLRALITNYDPKRREQSQAQKEKMVAKSAGKDTQKEKKSVEEKREEATNVEGAVSMEDIDDKLDELLENDIQSV